MVQAKDLHLFWRGRYKILIVCDRGALDAKAYMIQEEFDAMLRETPYTELEVYSTYVEVILIIRPLLLTYERKLHKCHYLIE